MPANKSSSYAQYDPRVNPGVSNPLDNLLPAEKFNQLTRLPIEERHAFYGRVIDSVFSSPAYQHLVFDAANREFERIAPPAVPAPDDMNRIVEEVVRQVLKNRK